MTQTEKNQSRQSGKIRAIRKFLTRCLANPPRKRNGRYRLIRLTEAAHLIIFPVLLIYCDILLRIRNKTGVFQNLLYPVLFGIAIGLLLNIPTTLFNKKINKIITAVLMAIICIIYTVECMIYNSYQVYMTFSSILTGAGGVMTGFGGDLLNAIVGGFFTIVLFMWPVVVYIIFSGKKIKAFQYRPIMSIIMFGSGIVLFLAGCLIAGHGSNSSQYTDQYEITEATTTFGLMTSLRLNMIRSDSGGEDGGFTFVDEGGTSTEAQEAAENALSTESGTESSVVTYGVNQMNIDFDALLSGNTDEDVQNLTAYVESLTPSNQNKYTGLFKGKNLIMITAEAFSDAVISKELTPTLYRMTHNGFYFTDYYQPTWGGSTITGEYSHILGLAPTNGVDTIYETIGHNMYFTMGNQLQRLGYFNAAFHNGTYNYYDRQTTHNNFGYGKWIAQNNGLETICDGNYPSDSEMLVDTLEWYKDQQPFSVYYMTVDGHCAYTEEHWQTVKYLDYVKEHVKGDYDDKTLYYLSYQYCLEVAMTNLIAKLEELGIADDTVIELTADHYPYGLAKSDAWKNKKDYVLDLYNVDSIDHAWDRDHNSLIIWSECLENEDKDYACEIDTPVFSLDILPTMNNLFGLEYDSRLLPGRDVFSDAEPLVFWNNGTFITTSGKYDSKEKKFYPNDGVTVDDDYVDKIKSIVTNKLFLSKKIKTTDYYGLLFGKDTDTSSNTKGTLDPDIADNNP